MTDQKADRTSNEVFFLRTLAAEAYRKPMEEFKSVLRLISCTPKPVPFVEATIVLDKEAY